MDKYKTGNFIYSLRKEKGISQGQLGLMLGVTNKAVSKWENGDNKPGVNMLYKLADLLGVSMDELIKGERSIPTSDSVLKEENIILNRRLHQAEREKMEQARKYWLTQIYLLTIVLAFFALSYASIFPFLNFQNNFYLNIVEGIFVWVFFIPLVLVSFVSGLRSLSNYLKKDNVVMNIVMLSFFPLTFSVFMVVGLIMLIPSMIKSYRLGFQKRKKLEPSQRKIYIGYFVSLIIILLLAIGSLFFEYLVLTSSEMRITFFYIYTPLLFLVIAVDTIIFSIFGRREKLI